MDKIAIKGQTNGRAVAPRAGQELPQTKRNGAAGPNARRDRLERLIAEVVARQSETLAEIIVQRVVGEMARREESRLTFQVADSDPIDRIPLPSRVMNTMRRIGVRTIGQLTAMREEDLIYLPYLGPASLRQLNRVLALFGRRLAG